MMTRQPPLTREEIIELVGRIEDASIAAIIQTGATREEVAEAAAWAAQESDIMGEERRPLSGVVEQVYLILVGDEEFPEER